MTVGELIAHLGQFDPDLPVKVRSRPGSSFLPCEVYPPFLRNFYTNAKRDHVLIEEVAS